jgi:hypothetical protein
MPVQAFAVFLFHNHLLNIRDIENQRLEDERGHSYAHFMYRTRCDQSKLTDLIELELVGMC